MSETTTVLNSTLLPLKDKTLLVPEQAVAAIIPFSQLLTTASNKKWLLGRIEWHGQAVPVICYEKLNNDLNPAPNLNSRFALFNTVERHSKLPYYAMLIQDAPRACPLEEKQLSQLETGITGEYDACSVSIAQNIVAVIPDLDKLEATLLAML
ncbi:MAG: chemotaxis protein CheW [Venatoribacter sp.]